MPYICIITSTCKTRQEYKHRSIHRKRAVVARDPVERDGSVVRGAEALAPQLNGGERPRERSEDGLDVSVGREYGEGTVRGAEAAEAGEEAPARPRDLEGRVRERGRLRLFPSAGAGAWGGGGYRGGRHGSGGEEGAEARGEAEAAG